MNQVLKEMGIGFSKDYFKKRYNLNDTDFDLPKVSAAV